MMWFICLCFSMYSVLVPKSQYQFFGLGILMLWRFVLRIPMLWYMCLHNLVFVIIVKTKKIKHNYFNYVVNKYFNFPNLCNIYLHNDAEVNQNNKFIISINEKYFNFPNLWYATSICIMMQKRIRINRILYSLVTLYIYIIND